MRRPIEIEFDLRNLIPIIAEQYPSVSSMYLFGSRKYRTGSLRSDIDILLKTGQHIRPGKMREVIARISPALDIFIMSSGIAVSVVNGSSVSATDDEALLARLDAEEFWARETGISMSFDNFLQRYRSDIDFKMTELPEHNVDLRSALKQAALLEGLPELPIIGLNVRQAASYIMLLCERIIYNEATLSARLRENKWVHSPTPEYDFQDLLYLALKPWFPELHREATEAVIDGQKKISDFNMFSNRLVIDVKFVERRSDLAALMKDLGGLSELYLNNPRCEIVLFPVYARRGVVQDKAAFQARFSSSGNQKYIVTKLIEFG